jgi:hypothetical protein
MRKLMLDLFAGTGGASRAFMEAGWEVVTVDNDPRHGPAVVADLRTWSWGGRPPPPGGGGPRVGRPPPRGIGPLRL